MSVFYNFRHIAVEQCHDKGVDVRTIDIGIGHDYHFVITQLVDIRFFAVIISVHTETDTQGGDDIIDLIAFKSLVPHRFFHIQDFTPQR